MEHLYRSKFLVVLFWASLGTSAYAQTPAYEPDRSQFLELAEDLYPEVMTMDAVHESKGERERFVEQFKKFVLDTTLPNPTLVPGKSWTNLWPGTPIEPNVANPNPIKSVLIKPKIPNLNSHSLKDLRVYVEQRLGKQTARVIEAGKVVCEVFGGRIDSALTLLDVPHTSAIRIPSFYEKWGIAKFYVPSKEFSDGRARLIFTVPPARQYLEHYASMLRAVGVKAPKVSLIKSDQASYRRELRASVEQIHAKTKSNPDYVIMGYYDQWMAALKATDTQWQIVTDSNEIDSTVGLTGRSITIKNDKLNARTKLLFVKSGFTVWGESSAFLADALLQLKPSGLIFMGSAGSLAQSQNIYSLSIPSVFFTKTKQPVVPNMVGYLSDPSTNDVGVLYGLKHGNTYSPIEQDRDYLKSLVNSGIQTIDVEQSLIANVIAEYNRRNRTKIEFGAINLITDRPADILENTHADHDLDRVDWTKKQKAREAAVRLALGTITEIKTPRTCQSLF